MRIAWLIGTIVIKGAVSFGKRRVWGMMHHFGGYTDPATLSVLSSPGPGDVFDRIAPLESPDSR